MHPSLTIFHSSITLYRYRDAQDVEHLVTDITDVPLALRNQATRVTGGVPIETKIDSVKTNGKKVISDKITVDKITSHSLINSSQRWLNNISGGRFHISSLLLGAGLVLILLLLWSTCKRSPGRALKIIVMLVIAGSVGSIYLSWLRHIPNTGITKTRFASPGAIIDQTQQAVDNASQRVKEKQEVLDRLE